MKKILRFLRLKYIGRATWLRNLYWANMMASFGKDSSIGGQILVKNPENIFLGKNVKIDHASVLNARSRITIGDNVRISVGVYINTGGLQYLKTGDGRQGHIQGAVLLEEGVWLASGSIINAGVTIGKNSVVASGAVVTKDVPPNVLVAGVPAKIIREIPLGE